MIKKTVTAIVAVLLAVAFISCDSGGGDSDSSSGITEKEYTSVPSVTSVEDLPASGATEPPTDAVDAEEMFTNAIQAINTQADVTGDDTDYASINYRARPTDSDRIPVDVTRTVGDGTIKYTGYLAYSYKYLSEDTEVSPNQTFIDAEIVKANGELNGTVTNCQLDTYDRYYTSVSYTVNGETKERFYYQLNGSYYFGEDLTYLSDADVKLEFTGSIAYAAAYSIKDEMGRGGKFIVTCVENVVDTQTISYYEAYYYNPLENVEDLTANLKVYTDSNVLVYETEIPVTALLGNIEAAMEEFE